MKNADIFSKLNVNIGGGDYLQVKSSTVVKLKEYFIVYTEDGPVELGVDITADFKTINPKYHEIFFNVISAKYLNKVAYGDNPFSECKPFEKRKWYEFWKIKSLM